MAELPLKQIAPFTYQIPVGAISGMRVPGEIIASPEMLTRIHADRTPLQVANVSTLPGIVRASLAMPDIHWGYGFPIGGVAAFDADYGIISPGGVGYDINCGVTLLRTDLKTSEIRGRMRQIIDALFQKVPCGVGSEGKIKLSPKDFDSVLTQGARWLVNSGLADKEDLSRMEEGGCLAGGEPSFVSSRARQRAEKQLGTLGSGNHFIEVQEVSEVFDKDAAEAFGLYHGQAVVMIHSGSRGLGHQICDETLKIMQGVVRREGIELPDRQLACAPIRSKEGQAYISAMACAANFAWGNRLAMVGLVRESFQMLFKKKWQDLGMTLVYDVCHNIAKMEQHIVDGQKRKLCIHRKGATRSLGAGSKELPEVYRAVGQPVLIPGDMGRASFVLVGSKQAAEATFSSTCHGAGRLLSRNAAIAATKNEDILRRLEKSGVIVRSHERGTLNEEVPEAYKDVVDVVGAVVGAGISQKVARLKPLGTIKG